MKPLSLLIIVIFCTISAKAQPWIVPGTGNIYYNGGNVGIGTTTPGAKLEVCGEIRANFSNPITIYNTTPGGVPVASISRRDDIENASAQISAYGGMGFTTGLVGTTTTPNSSTSKLWITSNGNVGIGTTSPSYKLQVQKTSIATPALMISGAYYGGPRIQTYGLDADANAWMGLGTDMAGGPYEHSIYFPDYNGYGFQSIGTYNGTTYSEKMRITRTGNVGIGTTNPGNKLDVNGTIRAKEVKVESGWADYVFDQGYNLQDLSEVELYINKHKHLPDVPDANEVEKNGVNLGEMNALLLKKIEELTLYAIEQNKKVEEQSLYSIEQNKNLEEQAKKNEQQAKKIEALEKAVNNLISK